MAKGSNSPATIRNQDVLSSGSVHGPNMSPESGGVSADHSHVDSFRIRIIVPPSDVVSGDSYIWQGHTDDGSQTLEGATGHSKDFLEGATSHSNLSKDYLEGATDYSKDLHEGATGYHKNLLEGASGHSKDLLEAVTGHSKDFLEGATGHSKDLPEGDTGYHKDLLEGATGYHKGLHEGATGYSKDLFEGVTDYSKDLLEGATDFTKDSTHAHDLLTGFESTSYLGLRPKKRPDLYGDQHSIEGHENKDILLPSASSWIQDTFQQSRLSGRELSPVRKSYSGAPVSHKEKHDEKLALHKERYHKPKKNCSLLHVHHLEAVHPYTTSYENLKKRVKEKYHPSVGKILFCQRFQGTCFTVGKHERRFIVTANHIFVGIGEHFKGENLQLAIGSVVVQFENKENGVPICYRLNPDVRCYSDNLDYIVVEMKPHERFCFPPPIQEFGHISRLMKDERVICIAFQSGKMVEDMKAALYVVNILDRLDSMSHHFNPRELTDLKKDIFVHKKQIIATSMIYGSSGGIVVYIDSDLRARVIGMILKGYPREFYLTPPGQNNTTGCQLVEVMIPLEQIALDIECEGNNMSRKFAKDIFGECH